MAPHRLISQNLSSHSLFALCTSICSSIQQFYIQNKLHRKLFRFIRPLAHSTNTIKQWGRVPSIVNRYIYLICCFLKTEALNQRKLYNNSVEACAAHQPIPMQAEFTLFASFNPFIFTIQTYRFVCIVSRLFEPIIIIIIMEIKKMAAILF